MNLFQRWMQNKKKELLKVLNDEGTVLLTIHQNKDLLALFDRVWCLKNGKIEILK